MLGFHLEQTSASDVSSSPQGKTKRARDLETNTLQVAGYVLKPTCGSDACVAEKKVEATPSRASPHRLPAAADFPLQPQDVTAGLPHLDVVRQPLPPESLGPLRRRPSGRVSSPGRRIRSKLLASCMYVGGIIRSGDRKTGGV